MEPPPPPVHTPPHRRVASVPDSLGSYSLEAGSPSTVHPATPDRPPPSPGSPRPPSGARLPMYVQLLTHALQRALALQPSQSRTPLPRTRDDVTAACISVVVTAIKAAASEGDALEGGRGERARLHADVRAALTDVWSTLDVVDAVAIRPLARYVDVHDVLRIHTPCHAGAFVAAPRPMPNVTRPCCCRRWHSRRCSSTNPPPRRWWT